MQIKPRSLLIPAAIFLIRMLDSLSAEAQDEAAGRVLFEDAIGLLNKGQLSEACPKFEESLRQFHNINAQYFLADCWEKQGKTASAWTTFLTVASKSREAGDEKRERTARKRADALEKRLVKLRVNVANQVDGMEVRRDGVLVGSPMWSMAVPVDPGTFEFAATAPGYAPFTAAINATAVGRTIDVTIPELQAIPAATRSAAARIPTPESIPSKYAMKDDTLAKRQNETLTKVPSEAPEKQQEASAWRTVTWVAGGVGVGTIVAGGVLAYLAKHSYNRAKSDFNGCLTADCEDTNLDSERSAISRAKIASGLLIGGAALAVAAGVVLVVTSGSSEPKSPRRSVSLRISPTGLSLEGRL
jgi:hypothetical protein